MGSEEMELLRQPVQHNKLFNTMPCTSQAPSGQAHHNDLAAALLKEFPQRDDDNDQDILDQHVSRVFSPQLSGTISPRLMASRWRSSAASQVGDCGTGRFTGLRSTQFQANLRPLSVGSVRHSRSMPDHASTSRRSMHKWPSMADSGVEKPR